MRFSPSVVFLVGKASWGKRKKVSGLRRWGSRGGWLGTARANGSCDGRRGVDTGLYFAYKLADVDWNVLLQLKILCGQQGFHLDERNSNRMASDST